MKVYATDGREYWTVRKLKCSSCGYMARHYQVSWDKGCSSVWGVPFAAANGGIQEERSVLDEFPIDMAARNIAECNLYLSECCDYPYQNKRGYVFDDVRYQCTAIADDGARCRLNEHKPPPEWEGWKHLGPHEAPNARDKSREWPGLGDK